LKFIRDQPFRLLATMSHPSDRVVKQRKLSVLVVDDTPVDRLLYKRMLTHNCDDYDVRECGSAEAALELIEESCPDCVLLDHQLPGLSGVELMKKLAAQSGDLPTPVIMITGLSDEVQAFRAMQAGATMLLAKGFVNATTLRQAVESAIARELPRRARMLAAEYDYACAAYTGGERVPSDQELAEFAIASEFSKLLGILRDRSHASRPPPNSLRMLRR
jgi:CheY-like chemotaxis protein